MGAFFDMRTLLAANAALSLYVAGWLLLYKIYQKTYPGFSFWMVGSFFVAITYILLYLSAVLPSWCIVFVHAFIALTEVLRLDGVSRFTSGFKKAKRYYCLPVVYTAVILYFTIVSESAVTRNVLLGVFSFVIILPTSLLFFKNVSKKNRNLYIATGLLYLLYGSFILGRSILWLFSSHGNVLSYGKIEQVHFFLIMIFEVGMGISILMINGQRLELDLSASRDDLQETVLKLQAAISEVNTLSGLLPICASCKKIRDDKGYWNQIEQYFQEHSTVKFSHGICPECMQKHYPREYEAYLEGKAKGK